MLVTRLNESRKWDDWERLMAIFLKRWSKPTLKPLENLTAMVFLESYDKVNTLVEVGSQLITPGELFFHPWQPLATGAYNPSLTEALWILSGDYWFIYGCLDC